ncbi:MAG: FtsK/SpoIIIE domain-containing protein [Isosphaeraceae bacterium]
MPITIKCPECGESASVASDAVGVKVVCRCGADLDPSSALDSLSASGTAVEVPSSINATPTTPRSSLTKRRRPTPAVVRDRIGRYEIIREIGKGAFGTVYLAKDVNLERQVALKVAHNEVVQNPDLMERFKKEAKAAARMTHEGIVVVHEVDSWESWLYIATEYIDGRTLRECLKEGPFPPREAARIAIAIAQALSHAHLAGVTHRDVKPTNVMLTREGKIKLIDFGLVHLDASAQTREHALLGTVNYMSPEQAAGDVARVKYPSDQYSLGVVLYQSLCGQPPYRGDPHDVLKLISSPQPVPKPSLINPNIPEDLEAICLKALSKSIEERYENCRLLAEALQKWLDAHDARNAPAPPRQASPHEEASALAVTASPVVPAKDLRSREPLRALYRLAEERATIEQREKFARVARLEAGRDDAERRRRLAKQLFDEQRAALVESEAHHQRLTEIKIEAEITKAEKTYQERCERIQEQTRDFIADHHKKCEWTITVATGVLEGKLKNARKRSAAQAKIARKAQIRLARRVDDLARRLRIRLPTLGSVEDDARFPTLRAGIRSIQSKLDALEAGQPSRLWRRVSEFALDGLVFLLVLIPCGIILRHRIGDDAIAAVVATLISAAVVVYFDRVALRSLGKSQAREALASLGSILQDLEILDQMIRLGEEGRDDSLIRWIGKLQSRYDETVVQAEWKRDQLVRGAEKWRAQKLETASQLFQARRDQLRAENPHSGSGRGKVALLERKYRQDRLAIDQSERAHAKEVEKAHEEANRRLHERWGQNLAEIGASIGAIREGVRRLNLPWNDPDWETWTLPETTPSVVRFGEVRVALPLIPNGLPEDPLSYQELPIEFVWPALLRLPERANLLVEAPESARDDAVRVLQAVTMRLLTSLPPGRVRLTIIDPLGLGGDFGAFFQLADFEAVLPPVLTDPGKIDDCLVDHLGHVKKVISYLRNEHPTIREYNDQAAEVAEPFRILLVSDFPHGFSPESTARLVRLAAQGPRCGVLTLVAATTGPTTPPFGVSTADLAVNAARLTFKGRGFVWDDPDFAPFPLVVDPPPPPSLATRILRRVGAAAEDARKVMVPFEFVTPAPEDWWTGDSSLGLEIGIGKAGPSKVQCLSLGKGTSQHVLIAGRTGSGKSSLFHALLVNLALKYGPDEVEFHLIDFKKGVEFKTYATHELPHARVIAVESEREFGLSVLRRLDEVLRDRGERFRQAGVHDLAGYREIKGLPPLPRIVLAVDEFQEFFVEDDTVAGESSQLLDRLVRQGRAFGVHVILGSQTLSGAYSLARSTLSQMGVRIALQCGEGDAHLILGEDNHAARLLSRPGEAVYNDKNGLADGNHFFQVVWLAEGPREAYLREIQDLAKRWSWEPLAPQVVFEGNEVASLGRNALLHARLSATDWPESPRSATAWLGEPVAIKSPTAAQFRREAGDNLLILGQDAESAAGVLSAVALSLASQLPAVGPSSAMFTVLDGSPEDAPAASVLTRTCQALPHAVEIQGRPHLAEVLERLSAELDRRLDDDASAFPSHFLVISNLSWFREIRRDDGFDFSSASREAARPALALSKLLRAGPAAGIHVIVWCDTLNNLNRALDRNDQREFSTRVAFQMSPADSSHFLDSPLAARLGPRRALFMDEASGIVEKFRPYGPPDPRWLGWAQERLSQRLDVLEPETEPEPENEFSTVRASEPESPSEPDVPLVDEAARSSPDQCE